MTEPATTSDPYVTYPPEPARTVALIDLLDRVLAGGVVISGDITLSIEGVDLVHVSLRALVTSVSTPVSAERL